ncbi:unnamed protein product [Rotaria sp. Silwood2]|nr:unnamed protein product [Rotaria sp. Silwood2]CAF4046656.1 unnamed protein product [Rotaria sp. Silwood2]
MYSGRLLDVAEEPKKMFLPIEGYEKMPLLTLEEAIKPLTEIVSNIAEKVYAAKYNSENLKSELTLDQLAAIMLYTMGSSSDEKPLYAALNSTLRSDKPDRSNQLKPWFLYLKLFISALSNIPSYRGIIYRGVKLDLNEFYTMDKEFVWWGFSSCTKSLAVLQTEIYLGGGGIGTIFIIECFTGKEIHQYSYYSTEDEVLLAAARQFIVVSRLNPAPHLWIIQIKEIEPPFPFLKTDSSISSTFETSVVNDTNSSSTMNVYSQCSNAISNLLTSNVETTTDDLSYNVKLDKDTMTYCDFEEISSYPKPIEPIIEKTDITEFKENDSHSSTLPSLMNSKVLGMPTENQQAEESIASSHSTGYYSMSNSIECHTAIPFELDADVTQTKSIRFQHKLITVESAKIIAEHMLKIVSLEIVYFTNNDLKDEGLSYILEAITNRSLLNLFIIDNNITDMSAILIAKLLTKNSQMIRILNLDRNLITAKGIKSIIQVLPRDTKLGLRTLSVCGNKLINDECIDDIINILKENLSLKCLYLEKCNLSADGKKRLQQAANGKNYCLQL